MQANVCAAAAHELTICNRAMTALVAPPTARQLFLIGLLSALVGAILFSAKAIVAKLIYRYNIDAVTLIAFRMLFSLPFFALIAYWQSRGAEPLAGPDRWRIVLLGLVGYYLASFLDFLGLQYISTGLERLLLFLTPSFVLLISVFFMKKVISRAEWMALIVSYSGIVLVFYHDVRLGGPEVVLGSALVLGSAVSYAAYLLMSGELVGRVGATRLVAYAMCVASAACILQFFLLKPPATLIQPQAVYSLSLINAVLCTVLPVFLTMYGVARIGASAASQAGMIGPVSTLFLAAFVLGEPVTGIQMVGTALVLAGIYLLSQKKV
jgi:drug/metabolite transporter (DMT)-like permease